MKSLSALVAVVIAISTPVFSQSPAWGQCGGIGWSGSTSCASGSSCTVVNAYYSQCIPGAASPTTSAPSGGSTGSGSGSGSGTGSSSDGSCSGTTKFKFFGVNQSGAEFGQTSIPGLYNKDYIWPAQSSIDYFVQQGFNFFRLPFLLERLTPPSTGITGSFDSAYFGNLTAIVNYITSKGAYVAIEPHNYMIYNGAQMNNANNFQTFWKNLASHFVSNKNVIFDLMNEPHDIPATNVAQMMQAGINGVRSSGATSQLILVEGTAWTGAWSWTSSGNAAAFASIKDPNNNLAIEMHQYLDSDSSGTSATCVSSTIGAERIADATNWLKSTGFKGFLGEMGAGSNPTCISAVKGALCSMQQAGGVWIGMSWWAAGPWWGDYFQSIEPPNGAAISQILPQALKPFL